MTLENKTERQTCTAQRVGDCELPLSEEACAELITRHGPMVKAACRRILGDVALSEDVTQEVFLLLVRKLPTLPRQTILGGWLYVAACHLARTHQRDHTRRRQRENQAVEQLMNPTEESLWLELEPLLDDAMLTLSPRQRELVLFRYFQNNSQRTAANLVGCSESVASRELAAAIERLRKFVTGHGVRVSGAVLVTLLTTHAAEATMSGSIVAAALSSASALAGPATVGGSISIGLMKTTTTTKIIAAAGALLITLGTVHHFTRTDDPTVPVPRPILEPQERVSDTAKADVSPVQSNMANAAVSHSQQTLRNAPVSTASKPAPAYDEAALKTARENQAKFLERMRQLALMSDPLKVQELLISEYGIHLSADEIRTLQQGGQKGFTFGLIELWAAKQPQDALAWAASVLSDPNSGGVNFHQLFLDSARKTLPNLDRDTLDRMVPEAPGKANMLDLADAGSDPLSLANRILAVTDPADRVSQLRSLAKGWGNPEAAVDWARQNLSGTDRIAFYEQASYELAHKNPQSALQVLSELQGTDAYASTFASMMRGLVQIGGQGQQAAELIANADLNASQRADLISELARRWVRNDPDAAVAWANSLTAPEDFRAAIPLLVSQLDNDRVSRTVETYLKNGDPVMELALLEAAAPPGLAFDPDKSRLILDPLIGRDSTIKLTSSEDSGSTKNQMLWSSVNQTAKRQAEVGEPAAAMEWLATLPFASPADYAKSIANVFTVWSLKSETEAAGWLQTAALDPSLKAAVLKATQR